MTGDRKSDNFYPLATNLTQSQFDNRKKLPITLRVGAIVLLGFAYLMIAASLFNSTRNGLMNSIAHNHLQNHSLTAVKQPNKTNF